MVTFVTGNKKKLEEVQAILSPFTIVSKDVDLLEIQGSAEEVTRAKAKEAADRIKGTVVIEDTCLCFNAFNGLPGPYIKWFLKELGPEGLWKMIQNFTDHSAYAMCTFGYCEFGKEPVVFKGITTGIIVEPRGDNDFGWDPIFQPDEYNQTYAEMDKKLKNSISHRFKAVTKLKEFLKEKAS